MRNSHEESNQNFRTAKCLCSNFVLLPYVFFQFSRILNQFFVCAVFCDQRIQRMGKHFWIRNDDDEVEDKQPGCVWGLVHALDYHHWHSNGRKMIHRQKYEDQRQSKCKPFSFTFLDFCCYITLEFGDSKFDEVLYLCL